MPTRYLVNVRCGLSTKFTSAGYPDPEAITKALQEGKSAPIPYTLRDMANDTIDLLDALKNQKAHIVGVSMSGNIAQLVAIDHVEHTLSLTLMASDSGNPAPCRCCRTRSFRRGRSTAT